MEFSKDNFYDLIEEYFIPLKNSNGDIVKIESAKEEEFKKVFSSDVAAKNKNIVYIWRCDNKIPRLSGESDIIYIGQTKQSFKNRYLSYAKLHAESKANSLKYETIIQNYGAITISVCDFSKFGENLLKSEGQLLWWYFQNHCEYPPINYTQTKVRNDYYPKS